MSVSEKPEKGTSLIANYLTQGVVSNFGEIPGYPEGSTFDSRDDVRKAKLHSQQMAGISFKSGNPADAIVLSGGYKDDMDDGDYILYSGQGGRDLKTRKQITDQTLTKGNLALHKNRDQGIPLRIIRGSNGDPKTSPKIGYRYDGLFSVESVKYEPSIDGPWIYRFELRKLPAIDEITWGVPEIKNISTKMNESLVVAPLGNMTPERKIVSGSKLIKRDTKVGLWVKNIHGFKCQFCGIVLLTVSGPYAEGAHIQPLSGRHAGPDIPENVLSLCANCHTLFDTGTLYVDSNTRKVKSLVELNLIADLIEVKDHHVGDSYLDYHKEHIAGIRNPD